jgi:uncharacterized protein YceH (UPF0502 family)
MSRHGKTLGNLRVQNVYNRYNQKYNQNIEREHFLHLQIWLSAACLLRLLILRGTTWLKDALEL